MRETLPEMAAEKKDWKSMERMNMKFKRVFLIVLDSLGIGNGKDAADFSDSGSDTLGHIAEKMESFSIPNLQKMGIGNFKKLDSLCYFY